MKLRPPSALSRALKAYREAHKYTQEELAALLDADPRQIRRWEHNETALPDIQQLKKIADRLGIPYEHLGIAPSIHVPLSHEQIDELVERIWSLIEEGYINQSSACGYVCKSGGTSADAIKWMHIFIWSQAVLHLWD